MEYKEALKMLSLLGQSAKFSSKDVATKLQGLLRSRGDKVALDLLQTQFSVKRVSGDLDRLYRMGFLKRTRVKRVVFPKGSFPCVRGFNYEYRISKQGWDYLAFISKPNTRIQNSAEQLRGIIRNDLRSKNVPKVMADSVEEELVGPFENRGRHHRFHRKKVGS